MAIPKNFKETCLDYLYGYSNISLIKTNGELDKKVKNLSSNIINIIPYNEIILLTKTKLQNYINYNFSGECIYCTNCGVSSKPIAFLRHLRNSIAHGNLHQDGKFFIMEDWDDDKHSNLTAIGKFEKTKIKKVLELLV